MSLSLIAAWLAKKRWVWASTLTRKCNCIIMCKLLCKYHKLHSTMQAAHASSKVVHNVSLVPKPVLELERGQFIVAPPPGHDRWINNKRAPMAIPCSALKDLVKLPVAAEWRRLGQELDVPLHKLNEIQANHEHSRNFVQDCLSDICAGLVRKATDWYSLSGPPTVCSLCLERWKTVNWFGEALL